MVGNFTRQSAMSAPSNTINHRSPRQRVDEVFDLLKAQGDGDYLGEKISQLEHCLQAASAAEQSQADSDTVIAALLHDIGQFVPSAKTRAMLYETQQVGKIGHEKLGADYLRSLGFKENVCALVEAHVAAKRYLTATNPEYYAGLSEASKKSFVLQGGPFTRGEVVEFEQDPFWRQKVQLREWDDAAKVVGFKTPNLDHYITMAVGAIEV